MGKFGQDLVVTAFGLGASVVAAVLLVLAELQLGFAFYSWMFFFIIPVGAILSGFVPAGGYYVGARLFHHRPTPSILFNMVSVAVGTFFLIHYLSYITMVIDEINVSDLVSFGQYLTVVVENTSVSVGIRSHEIASMGELGGWGYAYAGLQMLGFAVGGLAVYYGYLQNIPYCEKCSKFFSHQSSDWRYNEDGDDLKANVTAMAELFDAQAFDEALERHRASGGSESVGRRSLRA